MIMASRSAAMVRAMRARWSMSASMASSSSFVSAPGGRDSGLCCCSITQCRHGAKVLIRPCDRYIGVTLRWMTT